MPDKNKANRQVCDVDIRDLATKEPYLWFDTANTTTQNITSDAVYAMANGAKRIAFHNPLDGTATIEAQIVPFKFYAMMAGGEIESKAVYADKKEIQATVVGKLTLPANVLVGTAFAYPAGSFADETKLIKGTFTGTEFTATTPGDIKVNEAYEVGYIISKESGVSKVSINNKKAPKAFYVTCNTVEKDENDVITPFKMTLYKATPQRSFELSQSSEGDPASITMTFDVLEDKDGNVMDMIEITE
jgi:hypothetical protein